RDRLLSEHGVLVRECGNKLGSSSQFMRLVVRSQPDVQRLLTGLSTVLYGTAWYAPQPSLDQQPSYALEQPSYALPQQPSYALDQPSYASYALPQQPSYALPQPQTELQMLLASAQQQQQQQQQLQPALYPAAPLQTAQGTYGGYAAQQAMPAAYPQPQAQPMAELTPAAYTPAGQMPLYQSQQTTGAYARLQAMQQALQQAPQSLQEMQAGDMSTDDTLIYMPVVTDSAPDPAPAAPAEVIPPAPLPSMDSDDPPGGGTMRRYPRPAAYLQTDNGS
ncbi:aminotransferase class I/II, partial [Streptomyces sp. MCAF7]